MHTDMRPTERLGGPIQILDPARTGVRDPRLEKLVHYLDCYFRVPGTRFRFGLDPVLGLLIPGAGDALSAFLSVYLIFKALRRGVPKLVIGHMVLNVGLDYLSGAIPFLGDLFDIGFKANRRNLDLFYRHSPLDRAPSWSDWTWALILIGVLGALVLGSLTAFVGLLWYFGFTLI